MTRGFRIEPTAALGSSMRSRVARSRSSKRCASSCTLRSTCSGRDIHRASLGYVSGICWDILFGICLTGIYFLGYVGMYLGYTWDLLWVFFWIFWAVLGYLGIVSGIFWDVHVFFELNND